MTITSVTFVWKFFFVLGFIQFGKRHFTYSSHAVLTLLETII